MRPSDHPHNEVISQATCMHPPVGDKRSRVALVPRETLLNWRRRRDGTPDHPYFMIVDPLYAKVPEIIPEKWGEAEGEYVLYALGPGIAVPGEVKNGPIYPNARLTAAIDLLLTSETIADAVRLTKEHLGSQ